MYTSQYHQNILWPKKFYDQENSWTPLVNDDTSFTGTFIDVSESKLKQQHAKVPTDQFSLLLVLLDLPHILDQILSYVCCDEPTNRRNRNVRNLAKSCSQLKNFVYQSNIPDYLELDFYTPTCWVRMEEIKKVYKQFLRSVNWKVRKLRLVFAVKTFETGPALRHDGNTAVSIDIKTLPLIQSLELDELILDFSEIRDVKGSRFELNVDNFLAKIPSLKSLTILPIPYSKYEHPNDGLHPQNRSPRRKAGSSNWSFDESHSVYISLQRLTVPDSSYAPILEPQKCKALTHIWLDFVKESDLVFLSCLPCLSHLGCNSFGFIKYGQYAKHRALSRVTTLVIESINFSDGNFCFFTKIFPNLESFEAILILPYYRHGFSTLWGIWRRFHHLTSILIFKHRTDRSRFIPTLRDLSSLKNLCIEFEQLEMQDLLVIDQLLVGSDYSMPSFNLDFFRLESRVSDVMFDHLYNSEYFHDILFSHSFEAFILSSYHDRKCISPYMASVVNRHPTLKCFKFGNHIMNKSEVKCEMTVDPKWCEKKLYFSKF